MVSLYLDFSCVHVCMHVVQKWGAGPDWWRTTFVLIVLCNACVRSQADTTGEQRLKWTQPGTVRSGHARLVLAGDTMAYCCQCARTGGYARLTHAWWRRQDLWSMCLQRQKNCRVPHCANMNGGECSSELQAPDCLRRWMRGNSWSEQSYLQWFSAVIEFEYTEYEPTYAHSSSPHSSVNLKV